MYGVVNTTGDIAGKSVVQDLRARGKEGQITEYTFEASGTNFFAKIQSFNESGKILLGIWNRDRVTPNSGVIVTTSASDSSNKVFFQADIAIPVCKRVSPILLPLINRAIANAKVVGVSGTSIIDNIKTVSGYVF